MSTFTQWNGPQSLGPSVKDLTSFIDAYNNLSARLDAHVNAIAPTDSKVHGIVDYVKDVKSDLEALIGTKATIQALNDVRDTANAAATQSGLQAAVNMLNNLIANKADISALNSKADTAVTNTLSSNLNKLQSDVNILQEAWNDFDKQFIDNETELAFTTAISSAKYIAGQIKARKFVDFTQWQMFNAPFAGTGSQEDTTTNGAFILGCLSLDWSDDPNAPTEANAHKASRAYIKYVNSHPFDAICDMTVTKTDDGYVGSLVVHVSKQKDTWNDMKFHLLKGTNNRNTESVYLAVSASGLSKYNSDYTSMDFRACGYNFLPVGVEGFVVPTGLVSNITSVFVGEAAEGITAIDNLLLSNLWSNAYLDVDGNNLISVERKKDPLTNYVYRTVYIGDEIFDNFIFLKRPSFIIDDGTSKAIVPFITSEDIIENTLPVPAIVRWPLVNQDGTLRNIPRGWHSCDGSRVSIIDYPDIEVLGPDEQGFVTLPVETHSIIRIGYPVKDTVNNSTISKEILDYIYLNEKISRETSRANTAEQALAARIEDNTQQLQDAIQTNIAEVQDNINNVQSNVDSIADEVIDIVTNVSDNRQAIETEVQRATAEEQRLQENINSINNTVTDISDNITTIQEDISTNTEALNSRIDTTSQALSEAITAERTRAIAAESELNTDLANEITRAITAETTLSNRIATYEDFRQDILDNVLEEQVRATTAENELSNRLDNEQRRAEEVESQLRDNIDSEITRSTAEDARLQENINAETERAVAVEQQLQEQVDANSVAIENAVQSITDKDIELANAISDEAQRAIDAEQAISDRIDALHPTRRV